ncbi:predicted protein [Lichtheimia corymbifera JMRC:FSU:9682]|uniref:Uncharacterized protein n=1 Tax=Lichtheimia corymbifera JMRC:FSU:9682 TaxID=1263082 RepID=A0A068RZ61_9FUNG|nr:predicted protein [Lichtheimia corymbifera JMRC:FSU:9682]
MKPTLILAIVAGLVFSQVAQASGCTCLPKDTCDKECTTPGWKCVEQPGCNASIGCNDGQAYRCTQQ